MPLSIEINVLAQMPLFAGIEPGKLKLIAFAGERIPCSAGEVLFEQGDESDSVYVVLSGEVQIYRQARSGRVPLARLGRGEIIGEIGVLCDCPRTASVAAATDLTVLRIEKDVFIEFVNELPPLAMAIIHELSDRLINMNQQIAEAPAS